MSFGEPISRRGVILGTIGAGALLAAADGQSAAQTGKDKKTQMHLGLVTYNAANTWKLDTLLRNCHEAGIDGVEFRTGHAHGVEPSLSPTERADVKAKCAAAGIRQISLGTTCEFQSDKPQEVQANIARCRDFVLLAKDLGARGVKVRPNGLPAGAEPDRVFSQIGKALAECGKFGADNGVEIWMEVHGGPTQMPAAARKIMDACGHKNVGLTWNSNMSDVSQGSVKAAFTLLSPFIRCCHITELWNDYPWRELFGLLKSSGYGGYTLCEIGASVQPEDGVTFLKCYRRLWQELGR